MNYRANKISSPIIICIAAVIALALFCFALMLPVSLAPEKTADFETAFFTSVSAFTLNGASITDNSVYWSALGKVIILIQTQLSALFIIVLSSVIVIKSGNALCLKMKRENILLDLSSRKNVIKLILFVIIYTLAFEAMGTLLYCTTLIPAYGFSKGLFYSFFTSVSTFTNCGLSILPAEASVIISSNIMFSFTAFILATCGSLGIFVMTDVLRSRFSERSRVNTSFALMATIIAVCVFALLVSLSEWSGNAFSNMAWYQKISNSLSIFASAKTANINMIDVSAFKTPTTVLYMVMMTIGGASGSFAGSLNFSVVFMLGSYIIGVLKKNHNNNQIRSELCRKAVVITLLSLLCVFVIATVLSFTEGVKMSVVLFQVVSAFFSSGVAIMEISVFTSFARYVIIFAMLLGRFGTIYLLYHLNIRGLSESEILLKSSEDEILI